MNSQNNPIFSDHYVNVRGYKTRYWDVGFSDSVVILVHGFGLSCEIWQQNIEELSKSHRVIAFDFWGAGKTDATSEKIDMKQYPEFIFWFMDALKIKKAKLVGHSLGGLLALQTAHNYPECIEKLILVGSAGFTTYLPWHLRFLVLPCIGEWMLKQPNKIGLKHAMAHNTHNKGVIPEPLIDNIFEYSKKPYAAKHTLNLARSGMNLLGFRGSLIKQIKSEAQHIQCPVLVLWGKNDRVLHYKGALQIKKIISHAKVEIFEKCGHLPQMEHPTRFNQVAHSFLTTDGIGFTS